MAEFALRERICVSLWIITCFSVQYIANGAVPEEYCRYDQFRAQCAEDEVVVMQSALFGRMRIGKCMKRDYGVVNCSVDVLGYMDYLCSGRHSCLTAPITNIGKEIHLECLGELAPYLEASYSCKSALPITGQCHRGKDDMVDSQRSGYYISSVDIAQSNCGTEDKPLVIDAQPMQKLNFTLVDFSYYKPANSAPKSHDCYQYGVIREKNNVEEKVICGGQHKEVHLYLSKTNHVEIRLLGNKDMENIHFLIKYEVIGCPEPEIPSSMWVKRAGDHILVGCYTSRATWRLECHNEAWQGDIGNCSINLKEKERQDIIMETAPSIIDEEFYTNAFTNEIGIAAAVVTAVFLSILLLVIGLLYDRRRQPNNDITEAQAALANYIEKEIHHQNQTNGTLVKPAAPTVDTQIASNNTMKPNNVHQRIDARTSEWCQGQRPPSHVDHIYDTPSYFDLDPDYMAQANNAQFGTMANRDSYLQPGEEHHLGHNLNTLGNRDSYLQPAENSAVLVNLANN